MAFYFFFFKKEFLREGECSLVSTLGLVTREEFKGFVRAQATYLINLSTVELGASWRPQDTSGLSLTQINVSASALNELN